MLPQDPDTTALSVEDVNALSDAALADFMKRNRRSDGVIELPVDGWDTLSKDERNRLAERLINQERALAQSPTWHSCPLDPKKLNARLQEVLSDNPNTGPSSQPQIMERSRSPTVPIDEDDDSRRRETMAYNDLVKHGGRPLYPIELLDKVSRDPERYDDLLRPWKAPTGTTNKCWDDRDTWSPWEVFQRQWWRWREFRDWQRDNRGQEDEGGYSEYVEQRKLFTKREFTKNGCARELAKIKADPLYLMSGWNSMRTQRELQQYYCVELHGGDFSDYVNAVRRRLARHGFTRPFQLQENLSHQDKLSTWIEYLNFEYWWLDRYTRSTERLKLEHDKAWQQLVDRGAVRPGETEEYFRTFTSAMKRQAEEDQALEAVQRATATGKQDYYLTQLSPGRQSIPKPERIRLLREATHKVLTAKAKRESITKRNDLISDFLLGTYDFKMAKEDVANLETLLPWVLQQIPLIEAEVSQLRPYEDKSRGRKRRPDFDSDISLKRTSKTPKLAHQETCSLPSKPTATQLRGNKPNDLVSFAIDDESSLITRAVASPTRPSRKPLAVCQAKPQQLRRSARIAARQIVRTMEVT
ncbi:hypothetical protein GJ744_001303 [Endocarpon pusillum]|uniref:Ankyrin 2,3/unc44 n=1 Tax=Endocarpon pusillum TaxID=364733 RepID=A0A8H7ACR1_9EURO|nr:hypothetical protein GJ744_001303 [Endocarpon pusillum]